MILLLLMHAFTLPATIKAPPFLRHLKNLPVNNIVRIRGRSDFLKPGTSSIAVITCTPPDLQQKNAPNR
jgi:hypothetical protein